MKYLIPIAMACVLAPTVALASDRWDRGDRGGRDRGYRYDRGERYYDRGQTRSKSSFGFGFGYSSWGHRDNGWGSINYRYGSRGYGWPSERCYRSPVVHRTVYVSPRYEYSTRYYDCAPPPPRVHCPPAPSVYYYDGGSHYSGSVYYFRN